MCTFGFIAQGGMGQVRWLKKVVFDPFGMHKERKQNTIKWS